MNVFLVGFMGSGKSSLGKKLAQRLSSPFMDLDTMIEKWEERTIPVIFKESGEEYFRKVEKSILLTLDEGKMAVIALGGGACCKEESWNFLENNGVIVYLKESPEVLYGRLKTQKEKRPLIASQSDAKLKDFIKKKLKERSVFYEKAHIVYEKEKTTFPALVQEISDYLK